MNKIKGTLWYHVGMITGTLLYFSFSNQTFGQALANQVIMSGMFTYGWYMAKSEKSTQNERQHD